MASLYATQIIGTIKNNKIEWAIEPASSIALNGIKRQRSDKTTFYYGPIYALYENKIKINPEEECVINAISVQGPPGLTLMINGTVTYWLGHTGIFESDIYNKNPIETIEINSQLNTRILNSNYYYYNKIIIDVIYKIKMSTE